jgi:membrane protease YdiL (CAAX protease family)
MIKNKYGEIRSGWIVVLSLALLLLSTFLAEMFMLFVVVIPINPSPGYRYATDIIAALLGLGAVLLLFALVYKRPWQQMGIVKDHWPRHLLLGAAAGIVMAMLVLAIMLVVGTVRVENYGWQNLADPLLWFCLLAYICKGSSEGIIFRGFLMTALKTTRNKWVIVLLPAVIGTILADVVDESLVLRINIFLFLLLLAYSFVKTGRICASVGFLIAWNIMQSNILGTPVSGHTNVSVMSIALTGNELLTGGASGMEGSLVCTLVLLIALALMHFFLKKDERFWTFASDLPLTRQTKD